MSTKVKTFTGSGSFDVREEMLKDSKDLLDDVEVTTVAQECVKLKQKEDEIANLEEQLKSKKAEADDIGSRVIPELLAEQGLSEIKLADGSKVSVKNVELYQIGDKLVSVGETSIVDISNVTAKNSFIGIASKDGSIV